MRKFFQGLLIGVGLTASTAVFASNTIQATLFPTILNFHVNGKLTPIDGAGDNGVLNYNNKAYIPLRLFSENIGSTVDFKSISDTDPQKHQIDVYKEDDQNFTIKDPNGFVSIGTVQANISPASNTATGIIKINKSFNPSQKKIRITVKTKDNSYDSEYVLISNPENKPLKEGDIRPFTAYLRSSSDIANPSTTVTSVNIVIEDLGWMERQPDAQRMGMFVRSPFDISFGSVISPWVEQTTSGLSLKVGQPMGVTFSFQAISEKSIFLRSPLILSMEITNLDTKAVIWTGNMPDLPPSKYSSWKETKDLTYFWDQTDNTGTPIPPGRYSARLKSPIIQYSDTEQSELKTQVIDENTIHRNVEGKGIEFTIEAN
ncbi:hypothetical protein HQN89_32535 [Paenibacillus frigoriresistens]|uniref:hypothetical protein n=1 Tax=Paenibacillus alginolyticus TaxID=59839 RepID=UPI001566B32B|nr:hypothetical protein [Paenibacillus frigoriresistens]NRF95567.1 hypothetical protein [Paenibacillus frigoriresistens]